VFKLPPDKIVNADDLERPAKRYLLKILFDWIAGGAGPDPLPRRHLRTRI
jgi:hypothetical protein